MAITLTTTAQTVGSAQDNGFRAELRAWYSGQTGNTAIVHVALRVTFIDPAYSVYTGTNKNYSLTFNGTSSAQYASSMNHNSPVNMAERTQSMSGGASISATGSWYSYTYGSFSVGLSDTVVLPAFVIAPTTPTLNVTNNNAHQNTISYGTSSYGNPSTGNIKLYYAANPNFTNQVQLQQKTTTGLSNYVHTGLSANTTYYYRTIATNGSESTPYVSKNVTTRRANYVPRSGKTKLVQKLLVPYNGLTKNVVKLYRGKSNGTAERIY